MTEVRTDPKYQYFPPQTADDERNLRESMARYGFWPHCPILIDEEGRILDGHHRARIAAELGIQPVYRRADADGRPPLTEEEKDDLVWYSNVGRRHLTLEQKRDLIRERLRRRPQTTNASVARDLHVKPETVATIRRDMEAAGEVTPTVQRGSEADRRPVVGVQGSMVPDVPEEEVATPVVAEHLGTVAVDVVIRYRGIPLTKEGVPDVRYRGALPHLRESKPRERKVTVPFPPSVLQNGSDGYKALVRDLAVAVYEDLVAHPIRGAWAPSER